MITAQTWPENPHKLFQNITMDTCNENYSCMLIYLKFTLFKNRGSLIFCVFYNCSKCQTHQKTLIHQICFLSSFIWRLILALGRPICSHLEHRFCLEYPKYLEFGTGPPHVNKSGEVSLKDCSFKARERWDMMSVNCRQQAACLPARPVCEHFTPKDTEGTREAN